MKQFYLLCIVLISSLSLNAQIGFQGLNIIDETEVKFHPEFIYDVDVDNDSDKDIIVKTESKIILYENVDGQGSFRKGRLILNLPDPFVIGLFTISDINNDGLVDIIAQGGSFSLFYILNTNGFQNPSIPITIDSNTYTNASSYDVDNDGDMDIITGTGLSTNAAIFWYENINGLGTFSERQLIFDSEDSSLQAFKQTYPFDFDGDGDLDVISLFRLRLMWHENIDGLGSFNEPQIINSEIFIKNKIVEFDLDNDSDLDFIIVTPQDIRWIENIDGSGSFSSSIILFEHDLVDAQLELADMDGDLDLDIVLAGFAGGPLDCIWHENLDGLGNFTTEGNFITSILALGNEIDFAPLAIFDINNDNILDIITYTNKGLGYLLNLDGGVNFSNPENIESRLYGVRDTATLDIDGDGFVDVIMAESDGLSWISNQNLSFIYQKHILSTETDYGYVRSVPADINGDGAIDIVCSNGLSIFWHEKVDNENYFSSAENSISMPGEVSIDGNDNSLVVRDIDNDGDNDILYTSETNRNIGFYENIDGQGTFGSHQVISTFELNNNISRLIADDLDGDGDLDIVASVWGSNGRLIWYENLGGTNFGQEQILYNIDSLINSPIKNIDIDLDGDIDIVFSTGFDIYWIENNNGVLSSESHLFSHSPFIKDYEIMDIDNDGDNDIILGDVDASVYYFENQDNNFVSNYNIYSGNGLDAGNFNLNITDLNNDGLKDILVSMYNSDTDINSNSKMFLLENLGVLGNNINGNVKFDVNSNDCSDSNVSIQNILVSTDNGTNTFSTFTLDNGNYSINTNEGDFITEVLYENSNYLSNPQFGNSSFFGLGNIDTINFCMVPQSVFDDLNIVIYSLEEIRPGFETSYQLVYSNVGTTQLSGTITYEFDDNKIQFLNASETVTSQTANTLTFDYIDLNPFESRTIDLEFNVFEPPTTNIDDVLVSTATINPVSGDNTEEDNVFELEQIVIGSYDPNDIQILEGDEILMEDADKYLHYIIRFQNTGTASAINIRVDNVLDSKLDWTTMQLQSLSHDGRVEITNGTDAKFIFDGINLPDINSDEPNSHGYIAYRIKPKSDVVVGDIFYNTADIFFDFNPPITTNTVSTEIVESLSVEENEFSNISIYPNPTDNLLHIKSNNIIESIEVYNLLGQQIYNVKPNSFTEEIDMTSFNAGMYLVKVTIGEQTATYKVVKE